jgi:hypothetical protein
MKLLKGKAKEHRFVNIKAAETFAAPGTTHGRCGIALYQEKYDHAGLETTCRLTRLMFISRSSMNFAARRVKTLHGKKGTTRSIRNEMVTAVHNNKLVALRILPLYGLPNGNRGNSVANEMGEPMKASERNEC